MRIQEDKILHLLIMVSFFWISADDATSLPTAERHISTFLYGSVILSCSFSFIQSVEGLFMIWEKENNGRRRILYWIKEGKENLEEQDPRYRGRVEISTELPGGDLSLTLRNVTCEDEGTYTCRAVNKNHAGKKYVTLSIAGLDAEDPTITLVTIDGKQCMKCTGSGVYCKPQVQWNTTRGEDLSSHGRLHITEQSHGRKVVESLLDYEVETDVEVWCHIVEGRLRRSVEFMITGEEEEKKEKEEEKNKGSKLSIICAGVGAITLIIIITSIVLYNRKELLYFFSHYVWSRDHPRKEDIKQHDEEAATINKSPTSSDSLLHIEA